MHATIDTKNTAEQLFPNATIIKGKGESAIFDLLQGKNDIPGIYRNGDNFSKRKDFGTYYPLGKITPINQRRYIENPFTERQIKFKGKTIILKEISLYETSGCPFECAFCATPALTDYTQKKFVHPGTEIVLRDVEFAISQGANAVHFLDDLALITPTQIREFKLGLDKIKKKDSFYWRGMTRANIIANNFSMEDLQIMYESGCWRIAIGIESGNQEMLTKINKKITKEDARVALKKLVQVGIPQIKAFFIMGFPNETMTQILETYEFIMELKEIGLTDISLFQFKPYPGTKLYEQLKTEKPEVLKKISFRYSPEENSKIQLVKEKLQTDASISNDVKIAEVPSGLVRDIIIKTLNDFYEK